MRRSWLIALYVVLFAALLGLLAVLIGSLAGLELEPGDPLPDVASPEGEPVTGGLPETESPAANAISVVVRILTIGAIVVMVFGTLFSARFRREFFQRVVVLAVTFVAMVLFAVLLLNRLDVPDPSSGDGGPSAPAISSEASEPPSAPDAAVIAVVVCIAAVATGGGAWLVRRLRRRFTPAEQENVLEEIAETARAAAARLRAGDPLGRVVVECYREMGELVSAEEQIAFEDHMTAREFCERLQGKGMRSEHADRLTRIFEVVRYGGRRGAALAEEAIGCLDAIRDHYARGALP